MGLGVEYRIEIDGKDVTSTWKSERRLLSVEVVDQEGETSDSCTLELDDREPHIAWPKEGARLRLWLGTSESDLVDMGAFTLDAPLASSPPDRLVVTGHAANFVTSGPGLPMQTQRTRTWESISLGNMVDTIAQEHNLLARVQKQLAGEMIDPIEQLWESDLAFLKRIAKRYDARVRVKGASGHPGGALEVVGGGAQLPQVVLSKADVEQWSAPLGNRVKAGSVTAFWFNPTTGQSGSKTVGKGAPHLVSTEAFDTAASARSHAKARLKDTERHAAQISVTLTELRTAIASGTPVALAGFRSEIDTVWNVVQVTHRADAHRARTTFSAEKAG